MSSEGDNCILVPHIGMQFTLEENARGFYNEYARRMGFSIQAESSKRSTPFGPLNLKYFVCYKASKKRSYVAKFKPSCDHPN